MNVFIFIAKRLCQTPALKKNILGQCLPHAEGGGGGGGGRGQGLNQVPSCLSFGQVVLKGHFTICSGSTRDKTQTSELNSF